MKKPDTLILLGMQVLLNDGWLKDGAVVVKDGLIKAIISKAQAKDFLPATVLEFPSEYYLVPGFIDLHLHGAKGHDVMDADPASLKIISQAVAEEGVVGFLATTMTSSEERLEQALKSVSSTMIEHTSILGVHLEGPFIASTKKGAQDASQCRLPDIHLINKWQAITKNSIKIVTLAPELPGALSFIQLLVALNIIPSVGHTNASYEETCEAICHGATQGTHIFNAMPSFHQRHPGAVGALLNHPTMMVEIIADGYHLHPSVVELIYKVKGKHHILLITDGMRGKCMHDGEYELGGHKVWVQEGKAALADGTLAGSTLSMIKAIKNMMTFTGCSLAEAIQMASANPARVLGLTDRKGSIKRGKEADLVVLTAELAVALTVQKGRMIAGKALSFRTGQPIEVDV